MNTSDLLSSLLRRLQKTLDGLILLGFTEVQRWPAFLLEAFMKEKLIKKAQPAQSFICPWCEEDCCRPVQTFPGTERAFIVCDIRSDTSRVPVKLEQLQQWQMSLSAIYRILSDQSGLAITLLQSLPIVWNRVFLFDDQGLKIDSNYLVKLSATIQPTHDKSKNQFSLEGDYWSITFNRKTVWIKNTKGIRYIDYLIRNKGKDVHVSELFQAINPKDEIQIDKTLSAMTEEQLDGEGFSLGSLDEPFDVMDRKAMTASKSRIRELDELIEEAEQFEDIERQAKLEAEKDQIIACLSADMGLAGKSRQSSSAVERARKSIEKRIRVDIQGLQETFPELAEHLRFIKTGTYCIYQPSPEVIWEIQPKN